MKEDDMFSKRLSGSMGVGARDMGAAFPYAQLGRYAKHTSSRWIAPWLLPVNTKQPVFLSEWGA